ncbi:MAG: DUF1552 domain-containing protein, partial [Myxococcota bacterium]
HYGLYPPDRGELKNLNRRQFLPALGIGAGAAAMTSIGRRAAAVAGDRCKRLIVLFTHHGTAYPNWRMRPGGEPEDVDFEFALGGLAQDQFCPALAPLYPHRERLMIVDGLSMVSAYLDPNGTEVHNQGHLSSMTGAHSDHSSGVPLARHASIDQVVAGHIARPDRLRSVEMAVGGAYAPINYIAPRTPLPVEESPLRIWDRVFGLSQGQDTVLSEVWAAQSSILDRVEGQYQELASSGALSSDDLRKLDQHRQMVRDLELRIQGMRQLDCGPIARPDEDYEDMEEGVGYQQTFNALLELLVTGMSCDAFRVATVVLGTLPGSLCGAGNADMHADFAHQSRSDPLAIEMMTNYSAVHAGQMAQVLDALAAIPEDGGTMLDNTMVMWVSELGNGEHGFETWPVVVAGGQGFSGWNMGRYIRMAPSTPPLRSGWQGKGIHQLDWPNDNAGVPHQKMLTSVAQAFGVTDGSGALLSSFGETSITAAGGTEVDLTGPLAGL